VAAVGRDEQPGVGELPLQPPRLVGGDERVAVTDGEQRRAVDPDEVGRAVELMGRDVPGDRG
jgi:hypothetical protein